MKKNNILIFVSIALFSLLILFAVLINPGLSDDQMRINRFSNENNISKELTKEIEKGVIFLGYTLDDVYDFEKIDNWANGQRYKFDLDFVQTYIAYCDHNDLVSINANFKKVYVPHAN